MGSDIDRPEILVHPRIRQQLGTTPSGNCSATLPPATARRVTARGERVPKHEPRHPGRWGVLLLLTMAAVRAHRPPILAPASLARRLAAIRKVHELNGYRGLDNPGRHPDVQRAWAGIRRQRTWTQQQAPEAGADQVRAMVAACPLDHFIGVRDRALLLLHYVLVTAARSWPPSTWSISCSSTRAWWRSCGGARPTRNAATST
jgi:hypothetical protein